MEQRSPSGASADLGEDLYREIILDHYRHPRNAQPVDPADATVHGHNPLCGDEVDVSVRLREGRLEAVGFAGQGCSISLASASMMTEEVQGRPVAEALAVLRRFKAMMTEGGDATDMGDLEALQGVRRYAARVKCAVLPWNALESGLREAQAAEEAS
ncbi:MAG TPA: SUF system NifU family Fe-S cluster assembly protein [Candidatus Dormibacteraeota bacterium]|nr:SUF system NifU family Fe-S cluster assembly protein [Candidatus Dormibacteraeota bacterium]